MARSTVSPCTSIFQLSTPPPASTTGRSAGRSKGASRWAYLDTPLGIALAQAMATAEEDPQLAESRAQFGESRYDVTRVVVDRAIDRRELPADADHQLTLELLVAPLHFRALLVRQPVEEDRIERMIDTLLHGLAGQDSVRTRPDSP
ncbi:TetR-like C-terminal domain-containing protein [Streptomyces sp. cg40]|uniref:TetR-like C-terminal domain-containing protein n=1 Tax=Streptomyces sp. cg40 TaxID=3419764 RepID=UPI003CFC970E